MKPELKKLLLLNLPYLLFVYLFAKCGQAYRLAAGADASAKLLHLTSGISAAFANPLPSLHPFDLCVGVAGAVAVRLIVYSKGKNAKKYRKGEEYGSARWGTAKDIAPYIDPKFENNILLTQTERLTMTGRPKDPKTARNKNVLVIGGSGSGKTRFYVKPNLMQCFPTSDYPTSFVVTDPKGTLVLETGQMFQRAGYRVKILNTINFSKSIGPYGVPQVITYQEPYEYYICTVKLKNKDLSHLPVEVLTEEQLSAYSLYMRTLGNRPDLFGQAQYPNASTIKQPTYYDVPPEALKDDKFAAMMEEATKYIGYPYVWGGSSPSTSFDCSGYISWVLNHSGWNVGRQTAQGLYNLCTPVSTAQVKPGDLVFFKGTYDTPGVSHCGIYVGNSIMLHCGDPISYTNLNSKYWQEHFYSYGRLP